MVFGNYQELQILTLRWIIGVHAKDLEATLLLLDFSNAVDFIHRGKMDQILQAYFPKETVIAIVMPYTNTKVKVRPPNFFNIIAGVLRENTLAPYVSIICLDNRIRMSIDRMKEYGFTLKNTKSKWYPAEIIINIDYEDDISASGKYTYPSQILPA